MKPCARPDLEHSAACGRRCPLRRKFTPIEGGRADLKICARRFCPKKSFLNDTCPEKICAQTSHARKDPLMTFMSRRRVLGFAASLALPIQLLRGRKSRAEAAPAAKTISF